MCQTQLEFTNMNNDNTSRALEKCSTFDSVMQKKMLRSKKTSLEDKVAIATSNTIQTLGKYSSLVECIKSYTDFEKYISDSIEAGTIAIDTETNNSVDPLTCKLMGLCIYTPSREKAAYIPVNHTDMLDNKLSYQITEEQIKEQLNRLTNTKIIMHNGKFDYKVLKCTCDATLSVDWDTLVGAKLLNENESAGLKAQYVAHIDTEDEKYSIDDFYHNVPYNYVEPEIFALYAAMDAYKTYLLYKYQKKEFSKEENKKIYRLFRDVENPLVTVIADMELRGVCIDIDFSKRLSNKLHKKLDILNKNLKEELDKLQEKILPWRNTPEANTTPIKSGKVQKSKNEQLPIDNINLNSSTQLAIILYDVLGCEAISNSTPRSTGVDTLKALQDKYDVPFLSTVLEIRAVEKLLGTYVDKLPEILSPRDNRLHGEFVQFGADTGRFASKNPNLQNIPSRADSSTRRMFVASPGYTLVGSDYSQQEPRLLAHYAHDENMINAYKNGKDLYATIASKVYHNNYEDNKEFYPDGTINPEGKHRRTSCKSLLLGIMYGMGDYRISQMLNCKPEEATDIKNSFFDAFPNVKVWIESTKEFARVNGYVEDVWGRRRHLPDIQKKKYLIKSTGNYRVDGPSLFYPNETTHYTSSIQRRIVQYLTRLENTRFKRDIDNIKEMAKQEGLHIIDNTGYIAAAERQCVNARVQGGAATMSKRALLALAKNEELNKLDFHPLILVHDEIIGECPIENRERVKELLSECMITAALPAVITPMKCDADSFMHWYDDVYASSLEEEYSKLKEDYLDTAFEMLCKNHEECTVDEIKWLFEEYKYDY